MRTKNKTQKNVFPRKLVWEGSLNRSRYSVLAEDWIRHALDNNWITTTIAAGEGGIFGGDGNISDGTTATADGEWKIRRTETNVTMDIVQDKLAGVIPATRILSTTAIGFGAVGVLDGTLAVGSPLAALCGVSNLADTEEAFLRTYYDGSGNYIAGVTSKGIGTNNGQIKLLAQSVDGDSTIQIQAMASGTGSSIINILADLVQTSLPAYDDDAAAGVGGLAAGYLYQTTGLGAAPLNAAGIVMVKQ